MSNKSENFRIYVRLVFGIAASVIITLLIVNFTSRERDIKNCEQGKKSAATLAFSQTAAAKANRIIANDKFQSKKTRDARRAQADAEDKTVARYLARSKRNCNSEYPPLIPFIE